MRTAPGLSDLLAVCALVAAAAVAHAAPTLPPTPLPTALPTATGVRCELQPVPASAPPGARVEVRGYCGFIHYHRLVSIYFDDTLLAQFDGVGPDYDVATTVPRNAPPGLHVLKLDTGWTPPGGVTAPFEVTGEALPCSGDCTGDGSVTVDELLIGVNIALELQPADTCVAVDGDGDTAVTVDELVLAVQAALLGCDPVSGCHDSRECAPPAYCNAPGVFAACGACQRFESDCERDTDCAAPDICAPVPREQCPCSDVAICQPGCRADTDCGDGEACDDTHRCVALRCPEFVCPPQFRCEPGHAGSECRRIPCDRDSVCGGGFCVIGLCYGTLGACIVPVP